MIVRVVWAVLILACICLLLMYWRTQKPIYWQACRLLFRLVLGMSLILMVLFFISRVFRI